MNPALFSIDNLVKTELPPLSGSVVQISAMLGDLNVSQNALANKISLDPVLAARILRLANSALYSMGTEVTNLRTAVSSIGNNAISEILMMSSVSDSFGRQVLGSAVGKKMWKHLLATALAASGLCKLAGLRGVDEAFTAGLLHDIGKLILLRAGPPLYSSLLERSEAESLDISIIERETFGFDHVDLGVAAAKEWNLPDTICNILRFHHEPLKVSSDIAVTRIINIADTLVYLKTAEADIGDLLFSEVILGFGFTSQQCDELWDDVVLRLDEISGSFA